MGRKGIGSGAAAGLVAVDINLGEVAESRPVVLVEREVGREAGVRGHPSHGSPLNPFHAVYPDVDFFTRLHGGTQLRWNIDAGKDA